MPGHQISEFALHDPTDVTGRKPPPQCGEQRQRLDDVPERTRLDEANSPRLKLTFEPAVMMLKITGLLSTAAVSVVATSVASAVASADAANILFAFSVFGQLTLTSTAITSFGASDIAFAASSYS